MTPVGKNILVRGESAERTTAGGIILPDTAREKPSMGIILAVGQDCGNFKEGMKILYKKWGGTEIPNSDTDILIHEDDILAIIEP